MQKEKRFSVRDSLHDQKGMAMMAALYLILVVALMGVGLSTDTSMDVRIAGYQKFNAMAFSFAEAAENLTSEILEDNIFDAGWQTEVEPLDYPHRSPDYAGSILIEDKDFYMHANETAPPSIVVTMSGPVEAEVAIQRVRSKLSTGAAVQMASGYKGGGKGAGSGGVQVIYNIEATGREVKAEKALGMHFRHLTD